MGTTSDQQGKATRAGQGDIDRDWIARTLKQARRRAARKLSPERKPPPPWDNRDIPGRFRRYGLDAFSAQARQAVVEFLGDPACWCLYLWGPTGSRKTTLAAAALIEARRRWGSPQRQGYFVPAYMAAATFRDVGSAFSAPIIASWRQTQLLLLDDLGKHRDTPHLIERLLHLLHERYDWERKTIITANMNLSELAARIDEATARRIREGRVIRLTAPRNAEKAPRMPQDRRSGAKPTPSRPETKSG